MIVEPPSAVGVSAPASPRNDSNPEANATPRAPEPAGHLSYLPVGLFGAVMGLTGLSAAWRIAHIRYGLPAGIAHGIALTAVGAFLAMLTGYLVKWVSAPEAVEAEFRHPVAGNLFGTVFVSLLLLSMVAAPVSLTISRVLWASGALGISIFAWIMAMRWLHIPQNRTDLAPAWLIPVIGVLNIPLAMPVLHLASFYGLGVFGLALGLFFAMPLSTLIVQRLLFEPPMPDSLKPSIFILVAPTAVGFSSYVTIAGQVDLFAQCLYAVTLFLLAVAIGHLRHLPACCPFRTSWWAVSFPLAACAVGALRFASGNGGPGADAIALTLLALATGVISALFMRTLVGIGRGELRTLAR